MTVVVDTHLHFYPCYDTATAVRCLFSGLSRLSPDSVKVGMLTERHDCRWFKAMAAGGSVSDDITIEACGEDGALRFRHDGESLYMIAGRQIATRERIEILALTVDADIPDGLSAKESVSAVIDAGGVPVVSWAPGKWFFQRGTVVRDLMDRFGESGLLVGDTGLRPVFWPEPMLMRGARNRGMSVLAGSDPLPFAGEEQWMGSYASVIESDFDGERPVSSVRATVRSGPATIRSCGRRCGPSSFVSRLRANARSQRASS